MPQITVSARAGAPEETAADTRVLGLFEGEHLPDPALQQLVEVGEAKPGVGKLAVAHEDAPGGGTRRVIIAGLGERDEFTAEKGREAAAAVAGRAKALGAVSLSWALPDTGAETGIVEGTILKLYEFKQFKSKSDDDNGAAGLESLEIAGDGVSEQLVREAAIAGHAANRARDLQNLPSNVATPEYVAGRAREIADQYDTVEIEVFDRDGIVAMKMGAFAAVAQGTYAEPQLIVLRYSGGTEGPHLGYVGKSVTFDTGGISLKPGAKMSEMKFDMSGGAAVIEAIGAIAEIGLPVTITAVVPATENMPSGRSVKPGDIVTARNGKTIEVNNTDAEGRLILSDALVYCDRAGRRARRRPGDADRRDHHRARLHPHGPVLERRRLVRRGRGRQPQRRRDRLAPAAARGDGEDRRGQVRRPRQRARGPQGIVDHRRALPRGLRRRHPVGAHGHRRHRVGPEPALRRPRRVRLRRAHADRACAALRRGLMREPGHVAVGTWSGGRFMHFGAPLDDERLVPLLRPGGGIDTILTADVYGAGAADTLLGQALEGVERDSYSLVGAVGHDFYDGERDGPKGFPRFTDPALRGPDDYADYLRRATERSLARCGVDTFDLLLLHNPDRTGFTSEAVWDGMAALREDGLCGAIGVAPGPANGFTLDLIDCIERFGDRIDWAMVILNPLEPWPGELVLPAAAAKDVRILTRVVDYGGLFHGGLAAGHEFAKGDHRGFRPAGWVDAGLERIEQLLPFAARHGLTPLQLACQWNLAHDAVACCAPTLIQEAAPGARPVEEQRAELAATPAEIVLSDDEVAAIRAIGDNTGSMTLKGGAPDFEGEAKPDRWPLDAELAAVGERWGIEPGRDLAPAASS